jgi:hypothetical protein
MAMSKTKATDVMLRQLILTLDRQALMMKDLTIAIHRLAQSNDDIVSVLANSQEPIEEEDEVIERQMPTHLGQTLDSIIDDLEKE